MTNKDLKINKKGVILIRGKDGKKGDTGKDGYTPIKNKDYFDGKDAVLDEIKVISEVLSKVPIPRDGLNGKDGESIVGPRGENGIDGKDGSPDTGEQIIEKLNPIKNSLDFTVLKNIPDFLTTRDIGQSGGGGGPTLQFQDEGVTITQSPITKLNVTGTGGSIVYSGNGLATLDLTGGSGSPVTYFAETPSGTINSSNVTFTLANSPTSNECVIVILDGLTQYNGIDYTVSGSTITFVSAPATGSSIFTYYNGTASPASFYLMENGIDKYLLENGVDMYLLE